MPGRLVHFELPADDTKRAMEFWGGLFGWKFSGWGEYACAWDSEGKPFSLFQTDESIAAAGESG